MLLLVFGGLVLGSSLVGLAVAGGSSSTTSARLYPTRADGPKRIGPGNVELGSGQIQDFRWFVAAQAGDNQLCLWPEVSGPMFRFPNGEVGGSEEAEGAVCGLERSIGGRVAVAPVNPAHIAAPPHPLHPISEWRAFEVGIAAYARPVERVRLTYPGGASDELRTRQLHKDFGVPRLDELRYTVFAVKDCVRRVEALEKGRVVATTVVRACNPKSIS